MTINELARLTGVSPATVSRVFSHHPGISEDIREHVFAVARKYGYHPRFSNKQKNVVIITPYDSIFPVQSCVDMILMALTQILPRRGFRLEILPINNLERLQSIQFCAAIGIGVEESDFPKWSERFSVPLIIMDRDLKKNTENVYSIRSDEAAGMELAISHLHEHGYRKIGCIIHGEPGSGNADIRYESIKKTLLKYGLPADDFLTIFSGHGSEKYVELIGKLLRRGINALFCPGGNAGIVSLYALSLYGKRVPEDVALIASEQTFFSKYAVPPQTTISPDYTALATAAATLLEEWMNGNALSSKVVLPYKLIDRESVV